MPNIEITPCSADVELRFLNAGLHPPADRRQGTYDTAQRLLAAVHWLRTPRPPSAEPSNTFNLRRED